MTRRSGGFTDLLEFAAKLRWQVGACVALVSGMIFHLIAGNTAAPQATTGIADLGSIAVRQFVHGLASFLQYIVPAGLLIGAAGSFIKHRRRQSLFGQSQSDPMVAVSSMTWRQFESLVGESFQRQGFTVTELGGSRADGGVDLVLSKDGERFLVQCKHWRARRVSVTVLRELYGVMAAQGAAGGYVVTAGQFTRDAREFAEGRNIELIDAEAIADLIGNSNSAPIANPHFATLGVTGKAAEPRSLISPPNCRNCGTLMVERIAKRGPYAGQTFWGCKQYPKCREIVRME